MGYKATEWAYGVEIAPTTKAVLLALAHRADDKTFQCYPGQQVLARMTGASIRTVSRALNDLEAEGVIARQQRRRPGGSRTSDLCTLNRSYTTDGHVTESHVTESQQTDGRTSPDTVTEVTGQRVRHIEEQQSGDHPEDHSDSRDLLETSFEQLWEVYPRRQAKADALKAYKAARKKHDADTILAGARRYALLNIETPKKYLKLPAGWLRDERWNDEDVAATSSKDDRARQTIAMGRQLAQRDPNSSQLAQPTDRYSNTPAECPEHPGYPASPCDRCARDALAASAPTIDLAELDPLGGNPF